MTSSIFFNINEHLLTDQHKNGIMEMCEKIQTFSFNDIFGEETIILDRMKSLSLNKSDMRLSKRLLLTRGIVQMPNNSKYIYKCHIFQLDEYIDMFITNILMEVYFQKLFRQQFMNVGITDIIIPDVLQYGKIHNNNDIIIFIKMPFYEPDIMYDNSASTLSQQQQYITNNITSLKTMSKTIRNIETEWGIYHNSLLLTSDYDNILGDLNEYFKNHYTTNEDTHSLDEYNIGYLSSMFSDDNLFLSNGIGVLIDFENASIVDYINIPNGDDKHFFTTNNVRTYIESRIN